MGPRQYGRAVAIGLLILAGCNAERDPTTLPGVAETLVRVGKRLGASLTPEALERLGADEPLLVRRLRTDEREPLARGYLRFRVDRPSIIEIAAPAGRPPFWIRDGGFVETGRTLRHPSGSFAIWSRRYPAGPIGLGVQSIDRSTRGHYAVFIRGVEGRVDVEMIGSTDWTLATVDGVTSPYADDPRPFDAIPADLRGSSILRPRREEADATALVRGKVWKTRVPSGPHPDQVVVSFGNEPTRSIAWTWRTEPGSPRGNVRLERADGFGRVEVEADALPIASDGLLNDPVILRHRATIEGLQPDTAYRYSVGDGGDRWTPWEAVRTAPEVGRDYAFLEMGDPQCGLEEWGVLLKAARRSRPDAGFLLIAGDLVDRGNERSNWDHFFLRAAGVFEGLPLLPCVGNHEYLDKGPEIFGSTFLLPPNRPDDPALRLCYAFEYADSFVAVLDSNPAVYSDEMAAKTAAWLDSELSGTSARWKFVVFHHPIYPSHPSREQPQARAAPGLPIFDRHKRRPRPPGPRPRLPADLPHEGEPPHGRRPWARGPTYVVSVSGTEVRPPRRPPVLPRHEASPTSRRTRRSTSARRRGTARSTGRSTSDGRERDRFETRRSRVDPETLADRRSAAP